MDHNEPSNPTTKFGELNNGQPESPTANQDLILKAVLMLLSDVCLARFELLMAKDLDSLEAASEVIESLNRYDFLSELANSETHYLELKKDIASDISNAAERVIRDQNPR